MGSYNRVILMGNVTHNLELRYTPSGTAVCDMRMAVNDRRKSQTGEVIEETVFVDVTLWGRTAEVGSQYLQKGSPVFIEGRLKYDTWETEGQKRSKLRVVGEKLQLMGSRGGAADRPPNRPYDESEYNRPVNVEDNAPGEEPPAGAGGPNPEGDDIPF